MFKDDIFDALGYVGSSKEIKNDQWTVFLNYVNKNFGVTMNGKKMSLKLNKFDFKS